MTPRPYSLSSHSSLARAKELMRRHAIRHLPIVDHDRLMGIVTDRDVELMAVVPGLDLEHVRVSRIMAPPIEVDPETPLAEVSA